MDRADADIASELDAVLAEVENWKATSLPPAKRSGGNQGDAAVPAAAASPPSAVAQGRSVYCSWATLADADGSQEAPPHPSPPAALEVPPKKLVPLRPPQGPAVGEGESPSTMATVIAKAPPPLPFLASALRSGYRLVNQSASAGCGGEGADEVPPRANNEAEPQDRDSPLRRDNVNVAGVLPVWRLSLLQPKPGSLAPSASITGYGVAVANDTVFVLGGQLATTATRRSTAFVPESMMAFNLVSETWEPCFASIGVAPSNRWGHAMTALHDSVIAVSGGVRRNNPTSAGSVNQGAIQLYDDVHLYNIHTQEWNVAFGGKQATAAQSTAPNKTSSASAPTPRYAHAVCAIKHRLILFGGRATASRSAASAVGSAATDESSANDESAARKLVASNQLWTFDTRRGTWKCLWRGGATDVSEPAKRWGHSMSSPPTDGGSAVCIIAGGENSSDGRLRDAWTFDVQQRFWRQINLPSDFDAVLSQSRRLHAIYVDNWPVLYFGSGGSEQQPSGASAVVLDTAVGRSALRGHRSNPTATSPPDGRRHPSSGAEGPSMSPSRFPTSLHSRPHDAIQAVTFIGLAVDESKSSPFVTHHDGFAYRVTAVPNQAHMFVCRALGSDAVGGNDPVATVVRRFARLLGSDPIVKYDWQLVADDSDTRVEFHSKVVQMRAPRLYNAIAAVAASAAAPAGRNHQRQRATVIPLARKSRATSGGLLVCADGTKAPSAKTLSSLRLFLYQGWISTTETDAATERELLDLVERFDISGLRMEVTDLTRRRLLNEGLEQTLDDDAGSGAWGKGQLQLDMTLLRHEIPSSDVTLHVKDPSTNAEQSFSAHHLALCISSSYFRNAFIRATTSGDSSRASSSANERSKSAVANGERSSGSADESGIRVQFDDTTNEWTVSGIRAPISAMSPLLDYLYSGSWSGCTVENALEVVMAAREMRLPLLKNFAESVVSQGPELYSTPGAILGCLTMAWNLQCPRLVEKAVVAAAMRWDEVSTDASFTSLPERLRRDVQSCSVELRHSRYAGGATAGRPVTVVKNAPIYESRRAAAGLS